MSERNRFDWNGPIQAAMVAAIILGANLPFYFMMKAEIKEVRQESNNQIAAIQQDVKAIHDEIKDFHGRLCAIEERNRK